MAIQAAAKAERDSAKMLVPASVALGFALGMFCIVMNRGASGRDSMLIVMAKGCCCAFG
jgi:hypothetical protein